MRGLTAGIRGHKNRTQEVAGVSKRSPNGMDHFSRPFVTTAVPICHPMCKGVLGNLEPETLKPDTPRLISKALVER